MQLLTSPSDSASHTPPHATPHSYLRTLATSATLGAPRIYLMVYMHTCPILTSGQSRFSSRLTTPTNYSATTGLMEIFPSTTSSHTGRVPTRGSPLLSVASILAITRLPAPTSICLHCMLLNSRPVQDMELPLVDGGWASQYSLKKFAATITSARCMLSASLRRTLIFTTS
jgi:hypothetical protein